MDECPEFSYKNHVGTFFDQVWFCSFGFPWPVVPFETVLGFSVGDRVLPMVVFVLAVVGGRLVQVFAFSVIGPPGAGLPVMWCTLVGVFAVAVA